ncbi:MAG: hypothetical protein ABGX23_05530 [Nautiliaceae bacterium]
MRLFILVFFAVFAFADDRIDLILKELNALKAEVKHQQQEIEKLKEALHLQKEVIKKQKIQTQKEFALKSCDKLKVVNFKSRYYDDIIPYYMIDFTLKNSYPLKVKKVVGSLFAEDSDGVKILQDYINRDVNLPPNGKIEIKKKHIVGNELEKYLKDEKNPKVYFRPTTIEFENGKILECN